MEWRTRLLEHLIESEMASRFYSSHALTSSPYRLIRILIRWEYWSSSVKSIRSINLTIYNNYWTFDFFVSIPFFDLRKHKPLERSWIIFHALTFLICRLKMKWQIFLWIIIAHLNTFFIFFYVPCFSGRQRIFLECPSVVNLTYFVLNCYQWYF